MNLQDIGLEFDADEEISSEENIKGHFDKIEFMNKSCKVTNARITQLMNQLADEPEGSQCSKQLQEEKAMPPLKTVNTNSVTRQNSIPDSL